MNNRFFQRFAFFVELILLGMAFAIRADAGEVSASLPRGTQCSGVECRFAHCLRFPLNESPAGTPGSYGRVMLFGKYLITRDAVRIEFEWSEPAFGPNPFPAYVPGMALVASTDLFGLYNTYKRMNHEFTAPFGGRMPASQLDGTWDLTNLRFVKQEHDSWKTAAKRQLESGASIDRTETHDKSVTRVRLKSESEVKSIEFDSNRLADGTYQLHRQTVTLPESRVPCRFPANSGGPVQPSDNQPVTSIYHRQGRRCEALWRQMELGRDHSISLPTGVQVFVGPQGNQLKSSILPTIHTQRRELADGTVIERKVEANGTYTAYSELRGRPLREVRLSDYRLLNSEQFEKVSERRPILFSFTDIEYQWYPLQSRYWNKTLKPGDNPDGILVDELASRIREQISAIKTAESRLRHRYILIVTAILQDDLENFKEQARRYKEDLAEIGYDDMVLPCIQNLAGVCQRWESREQFVEAVRSLERSD